MHIIIYIERLLKIANTQATDTEMLIYTVSTRLMFFSKKIIKSEQKITVIDIDPASAKK